jgi:DeoR/GlpR family transcriptional regulator of sugar metabolism
MRTVFEILTVMERISAFQRLQYVKWLIERKATGSPKDLAEKLNVSERTVYRLVQTLEHAYQLRIEYSGIDMSYVIVPADNK